MNNSHQEVIDIQETEFGGAALSRQKRIIHFCSGETLEDEDSEEEEEEEEEDKEQSSNRAPFREPAERSSKPPFSFKNAAILVGRVSLLVCDFLGERVAGALGLNAAKYQYAIDQYHRDHKTTCSQTTNGQMKRQVETTHLSPGLDGSLYGTTGNCNEKNMDRNEGRHNKAYEADEE